MINASNILSMDETLAKNRQIVNNLLKIWQTTLKCVPISETDNFFDLGGDSMLAVAIFDQIERELGQKLPLTVIYDAPTIVSLATRLQQADPCESPPSVLLKPGTSAPPLFLAIGSGNISLHLSRLARALTSGHPVYGIKIGSFRETGRPYDRVEEIAANNIEVIRRLQPHGPYLLAGHSFGGLVMLEVARLLQKHGEEIALLALLDTYPHMRAWSASARVDSMRRHFLRHFLAIRWLPARERYAYVLQRYLRYLAAKRARNPKTNHPHRSVIKTLASGQLAGVIAREHTAWSDYRPRFYPGRITFLKAESSGVEWPASGVDCPGDPQAVWGRLARTLQIHSVPGNHVTMLTEHPELVAARLADCIKQVMTAAGSGANAATRTTCETATSDPG